MKIRWTPDANRDRAEFRRYIKKHNPKAAIAMHLLFLEAAAQLADFPDLGKVGQVRGTRELLPHRSYRLVYRVIGDTVWVLNLVHTARRWPPSVDSGAQ